MGNSESSSGDPRFITASRAFTSNELEDLRSLFSSLAAHSQTNSKFISAPVFKSYVGIDGPLGDRLFYLVSQKRNDHKLTFEDFVITKGTYEKGTKEDIEQFIYELLDVSDDGLVTRADLEAVLTAILDNLFEIQNFDSKARSHEEVVQVYVNATNYTSDCMSFEDFRVWCTLLPAVRKFLACLLMPSDRGSQIPTLRHPDNIDPGLLLLRKEYAWHIGGALSVSELGDWNLLYHSSLHGLSFSTFLGNVATDGPTVLIIKDREGHIYGGYASQPWERHADFYGDMKSFIFQLYPRASLYRPTGANHNLQWCATNFSSESIPNGIGFGGKANHFGLFLSANFDQGHTFTCTTYSSPCLSNSSRIYPEVIECWGVAPQKIDQDRTDGHKGTVLERFKEDRHMLNMVGLANSSE